MICVLLANEVFVSIKHHHDQSISSGHFAEDAGRHHVCGESPRDGRAMEEIPLPVDTDAPGRECGKEVVVSMHGIDRICGTAAFL